MKKTGAFVEELAVKIGHSEYSSIDFYERGIGEVPLYVIRQALI